MSLSMWLPPLARSFGFLVPRTHVLKRSALPNSCKELIRQMRKYRWAKPPKHSLKIKRSPQQPVKEDDDSVDCLHMYCFTTCPESQIKEWEAVKLPYKPSLFATASRT